MSSLRLALGPYLQELVYKSAALVCSGTPLSVDRQTLDELEQKAVTFISNIRQCYNSSSTLSINRLPPEVLQIVFHYLIAPSTTSKHWSTYPGLEDDPYERLTRAMLVCRKWHSIATQTVSLWTEIDLAARPSSVVYFLERSRAVPIQLRAKIAETENQVVQSIIRQQRHRISELVLQGPCSAQPQAHATLADVAMPILRKLTLTFEPQQVGSLTRTHFAKPEHVPAMRALLLMGALWIPIGIVPSLTHILVKDMQGVSVSSIWNLLCNTPMLEIFDISSNTGLEGARGATPPSSLILSRLQELTITGAHTDVVHYLMSRLEVPNVAAVSFQFLFGQSGTLLERLLPESLAAHAPTRVTLVIGDDYNTFTAGFQGDSSTVTLSYYNTGGRTTPRPGRDERRRWPFATFPTLLSLARVTTFRLSSSVWEEDYLVRLGPHFESVTELCLMLNSDSHRDGRFDAAAAMELGVALSRMLLADSPVVFPTLCSLDVDTVDTSWDFIDVLVPALEKRERDGRRLRYLCVNIDTLWPPGRFRDRNVDLNATGLFDHVDEGVCRRSDNSSIQDWDREVKHGITQRPTHGYW